MYNLVTLEPVDYLVIGHVSQDLTPSGARLGGTASYSSLTAKALGLRVGVYTASGPETDLKILQDVSQKGTTWSVIYSLKSKELHFSVYQNWTNIYQLKIF